MANLEKYIDMKKHIINIGYPRCGTTWLWYHLNTQLDLSYLKKEDSILQNTADIEKYRQYYQQFDLSFNFHPHMYLIDQWLIQQLDSVATHASIILRNPYQQLRSYYDLIGFLGDSGEFVDFAINTCIMQYSDIVCRWRKNLTKSLRIFLFDDIEHNPEIFLQDYLNFCELDLVIDKDPKYNVKINSSDRKTNLVFSNSACQLINAQIKKLQDTIDRDLTTWLQQ